MKFQSATHERNNVSRALLTYVFKLIFPLLFSQRDICSLACCLSTLLKKYSGGT